MNKFWPPIVGIAGGCLLIFGVVFSVYIVPCIEEQNFKKESVANGTRTFEYFVHNSAFTVKFRVYFFNVVNPKDIIYEKATPKVEEVGPYVYDVEKTRRVKNLNESQGTIEFSEIAYFHFNSTESKKHTEDDFFTTVNVVLLNIANIIQEQKILSKEKKDELMEMIPDLYKLFLPVKVKDILFDGVTINCSSQLLGVCVYMRYLDIRFLKLIEPNFQFSFFNHFNNTPTGPFKMYLKSTSEGGKGKKLTYKGKNQLATWLPKGGCNKIQGTNTYMFPSMAFPEKKIYTFFLEFCRSIPFIFEKRESFRDVPAYTFVSSSETFDHIRQNVCFCKKNKFRRQSISCNVKGTMNLHNCQNFPTILSFPHFYMGDTKLFDYVDGLTAPKKDRHGSFITIEPASGFGLKTTVRFQYNIKLSTLRTINNDTDITEGILPILWMEETLEAKPEIIDYFTDKILFVQKLHLLRFLFVGLGILIMLLSVVLMAYREIRLTREVFKKRDDFGATFFQEKTLLKGVNVNLYPQVVNRNISDAFTKRNQRN